MSTSSVLAATSQSYSGTVQKYSDFESSSAKKGGTSDYATNNSTSKPSGSFVSWIEFAESKGLYNNGSNCTDKTTYSDTGKWLMKYQNYIDADGTIASAIKEDQVSLKLNISTSLTNFNSGTVAGYWSPDQY